jgi:GNAT superfamily N-acetyltransferase
MSGEGIDRPRIRDGRADVAEAQRAVERAAAVRFAAVGVPELAAPGDEDLLPAALLQDAARARRLLVAECKGAPVGFALLEWLDGAACLRELDVTPAAGGRRLGGALLEAACERARDCSAASITLSTFRDVPFNAPFYARHGFREVDRNGCGPALSKRLEEEARAGLDPRRRCVLRRVLA